MKVYWLSQELNYQIKKKTLLILESVQKKIKYVLMKVFFINIAIISLKF